MEQHKYFKENLSKFQVIIIKEGIIVLYQIQMQQT